MKICIVAHNAYRMLSGNSVGHIGGIELQCSMTARWFANAGHEVTLVTWAEGSTSPTETIDGVTVVKTCAQDAGMRIVRFFYPRWVTLARALRFADADVYYQNGAEYVTGQVGHWCRRNGKKFVFSTASDVDCSAELPLLTSVRERLLYRFGLRVSDQIIVQTSNQQQALEKNFGCGSIVLPMPCDLDPISETTRPEADRPIRRVVLIGRLAREKNIEMFIDVARQLPDIDFAIIGPESHDPDYVSSLKSQASQLENVSFLGPKTRNEIGEELGKTSLLCCTSHYEGFPNTFIEAWSQGVPVVSTIDPDGILVSAGIGAHEQSATTMACRIRELFQPGSALATMASAARKYYVDTHHIDAAMLKFRDAFDHLLASGDVQKNAGKQ